MRRPLLSLLLPLFLTCPPRAFAHQDGAAAKEEVTKELTLERLFPEKSYFGPSASGATFSHDGAYAAFLWRPWLERRHGSDLWILDVKTGEARRVTSVSVMAPFQAATRKVARDRVEKAKAAQKKGDDGKNDDDGEKGDSEEKGDGADGGAPPDDLEDVVQEDDAEDEDAPRYGGVSSIRWSPTANELFMTSGGDVYRWKVGDEAPQRLTRTRERERSVQWLPDGSGYTYQSGSALLRVVNGRSMIEQLDPPLGSGEELEDHALSPDGKRVVLIARKRIESGERRTVNIADYDGRFMKVRQVPRTVSDDPRDKSVTIVYLYALPDAEHDDGKLYKVHSHERSGPRDTVRLPDWAPDSSKVVFSIFEQESGQVHVLEADFPDAEEAKSKSWGELVAEAKPEKEAGKEKKGEKKGEEAKGADEVGKPKPDEVIERPAKIVYRFLHTGGPTTPRMIAPRFLADSRHVVLLTEHAGFRHISLLDPVYETLEPLTSGRFEVYPDGMPEHREWMVVTSTREDSACLDAYRVDLPGGGMQRLTKERGRYESVAVAPDGSALLARFSRFGAPRELVLVDTAAGTQKALTDSHSKEAHELTQAVPELFTYENRHGQNVRGMLFQPADWKKTDKRPLLIYVYGGPLGTRKEVIEGSTSASAYLFARYMSEVHGYVTATIDPRGMSGYGALFEKANFEQVGKPQVEDLVDGVEFLIERGGIDPKRVGMHGWSFGGFQTQMCLYTEPEVFTCGIAGAGPTEWENYNSWYSTGTIGNSRPGETDLEKYSLLPLAKNLKGKLLLVHGMEDSNVLYQDTVRVYAELLKAGKETLVELFLDPSGGHGLGGHIKRLGRYRKYEEFLVRCLGSEKSAD